MLPHCTFKSNDIPFSFTPPSLCFSTPIWLCCRQAPPLNISSGIWALLSLHRGEIIQPLSNRWDKHMKLQLLMKIHPFHLLPIAAAKTFALALAKKAFAFTLANWTSFKPSRANDQVIALHPTDTPKTLHIAALSAHTSEPEWRQAERTEAGKIEMWLRVWVRNL